MSQSDDDPYAESNPRGAIRETTRVILVEDEPFWQEAIAETIRRHPSYQIAALCSSLAEALQSLRTAPFDLMIIDLGLPDGTGIDAIRAARRHCPEADILVSTVFADERSVVAAICAGATGYLVKEATGEQWIAAIDDLRAGRSPISPQIARHILRAMQQPLRARRFAALGSPTERVSRESPTGVQPRGLLSTREIEVLSLIAKGFSLSEVGQILHVSSDTARSHAKSIYRKLEVNSRGEAVFEATSLGLL
jgi:DNA-binding NarL/FixJ family response regulator